MREDVTMEATNKLYNLAKYNPSRGGHAQGHLREAFAEYVEAYVATEEKASLSDVVEVGVHVGVR
jgi:hypothetical protein